MKMSVFWVVSPCILVQFSDVSEVLADSNIKASTSKTSVKVCQTARRNNPEDRHLNAGNKLEQRRVPEWPNIRSVGVDVRKLCGENKMANLCSETHFRLPYYNGNEYGLLGTIRRYPWSPVKFLSLSRRTPET
jgi:hypothetical protein